MNYLSSDIEDLEILEECILKQKMVVNMIGNIILFGEKNLHGEFLSDAKYVHAIGESADVAALDTWRGGSPKGEDEGFNAAIVRTKKGLDLMNGATKAGFIHIGDKLKIEDIDDFQPHQVNKKKAVYARHLGMTKNDVPTINTKGLRIKELYKLNSEDFNKKEELGVGKRIKKI